ncbi:hypothetical protein LTR78_006675 [Recurvomyces mirabilis]|uniref:Uncharacterized protein n=1 Tax=Recurvomyces mirabilis TaxID=574656 RepID=A0AAE0WKL0_9PEZI|nr:hypothetical protein LTR78_006675 [Recurvomyces mirabilis]
MGDSYSTGEVNNQAPKPDGVNTVCLSRENIEKLEVRGYNDPTRGQITWKTVFSSDRMPTDWLTTGIATCINITKL